MISLGSQARLAAMLVKRTRSVVEVRLQRLPAVGLLVCNSSVDMMSKSRGAREALFGVDDLTAKALQKHGGRNASLVTHCAN